MGQEQSRGGRGGTDVADPKMQVGVGLRRGEAVVSFPIELRDLYPFLDPSEQERFRRGGNKNAQFTHYKDDVFPPEMAPYMREDDFRSLIGTVNQSQIELGIVTVDAFRGAGPNMSQINEARARVLSTCQDAMTQFTNSHPGVRVAFGSGYKTVDFFLDRNALAAAPPPLTTVITTTTTTTPAGGPPGYAPPPPYQAPAASFGGPPNRDAPLSSQSSPPPSYPLPSAPELPEVMPPPYPSTPMSYGQPPQPLDYSQGVPSLAHYSEMTASPSGASISLEKVEQDVELEKTGILSVKGKPNRVTVDVQLSRIVYSPRNKPQKQKTIVLEASTWARPIEATANGEGYGFSVGRVVFVAESATDVAAWVSFINGAKSTFNRKLETDAIRSAEEEKMRALEKQFFPPVENVLVMVPPRFLPENAQLYASDQARKQYQQRVYCLPPLLRKGEKKSPMQLVRNQIGQVSLPIHGTLVYSTPEQVHIIAAKSRLFNFEHVIGFARSGRNGAPGRDGLDGRHGNSGASGSTGSRGHDGTPGQCGTPGMRGEDGEPGARGQNLQLILSSYDPAVNALSIAGPGGADVLHFQRPDGLILAESKGGDGGDGGTGGRGGDGGRGGCGGRGGRGRDGRDANRPGERGGNGERGCDGGNGAPGGDGSSSGDGGNGAPGGAGGVTVVASSNPALLHLVRCDARKGAAGQGGAAGRPGFGGAGGSPGPGGSGGSGGRGGPSDDSHSSGSRGSSGSSGSSGRPGARGRDGASGRPGVAAAETQDGKLSYAILDNAGTVLESSPFPFEIAVSAYEVHDDLTMDVFEPGGHITVRNIVVANVGGLTSPEGGMLEFRSTPTVTFEQKSVRLPSLAPGASALLENVEFHGKIFNVPEPVKPEPLQSQATFASGVELLSRPFFESHTTTVLPVQYPCRFGEVTFPSLLGGKESGKLVFPVANLASRALTDEVVLKVVMDPQIVHATGMVPADSDGTYLFPIREIPANETVVIELPVTLGNGSELFEQYDWRASLVLRGTTVEFRQSAIRKAPVFTPQPDTDRSADILIFTSSLVTRREYLIWSQLISALGLSADYWDLERYGGFVSDDVEWVGRYNNATLLLLQADHFVGRFVAADMTRHLCAERYCEGSIIFHGLEDESLLGNLLDGLFVCGKQYRYVGGEFAGKHLIKPPEKKDAQRKAGEILSVLDQDDPNFFHRVAEIQLAFRQLEGKKKYHYGACHLQRLSIPKISRVIMAFGSFSHDHLDRLEIGSGEASAFLALVASTNFLVRCNLTLSQDFCSGLLLPGGQPISMDDVVFSSIVAELERVWRHTADAKELGYALYSFSQAIDSDDRRARFASALACLEEQCVSFRDASEKKKLLKSYKEKLGASSTKSYHSLDAIAHIAFPLASESPPAAFEIPDPVDMDGHGQVEGSWQHGDVCTCCDSKFGPFRYRKHCRNCGDLVCDKCSPYRAVVPHLGRKERRVCAKCLPMLERGDEEAKMSGYMLKKGEKGVVKGWKRRYFYFSGPKLFYSESEALETKNRGHIDCHAVVAIRPLGAEKHGGLFDVETVSGRVYQLDAKDAETRRKWIEAIEACRK